MQSGKLKEQRINKFKSSNQAEALKDSLKASVQKRRALITTTTKDQTSRSVSDPKIDVN